MIILDFLRNAWIIRTLHDSLTFSYLGYKYITTALRDALMESVVVLRGAPCKLYVSRCITVPVQRHPCCSLFHWECSLSSVRGKPGLFCLKWNFWKMYWIVPVCCKKDILDSHTFSFLSLVLFSALVFNMEGKSSTHSAAFLCLLANCTGRIPRFWI